MEPKGSIFFKPLDGEVTSVEEALTEVESFCVNCGENGTTRLLLTAIPFYKEVILSSFSCPHCDYSNNEMQSAGEIQKQGIELILRVEDATVDLNRTVVKSDHASVTIPHLEFEIPAGSQKGEITTVEGILLRVQKGLQQDQPKRKELQPQDYQNIQQFISKLHDCTTVHNPFVLRIRDNSGNSFISPPPGHLPGQKDEGLTCTRYSRTASEDHVVGYFPEMLQELREEEEEENENGDSHKDRGLNPDLCNSDDKGSLDLSQEVLEFPTPCPDCGTLCKTKMKLTKIPYFKEVVVMATDCDNCGSRTNEVKSGGPIEPKGRKITLTVTSKDDLSRDVLKSETCSIEIPELEFEVGAGVIVGKFTTLEGLLCNLKEQVLQENPLITGDSAAPEMKAKMDRFRERLDLFISCRQMPFTVILNDPAGNSYLQNIRAPHVDPNLNTVDYERTFEQNEELGLNDINVGDGDGDGGAGGDGPAGV